MRSTATRRSIAMAAAATLCAGALGTPAAARGAATTRSLPAASAPSTERSLVDLLAGSPRYLVYIRTALLPAGGHVDGAPINSPRTRLFVRSTTGTTRDLGHAPSGLQHQMSLSGQTLTGATELPNYAGFKAAYWWDISSHRHGVIRVPMGYHYLAAAPHGAVLSKAGELFTVSRAGKVSSLGTPFTTTTKYLTATSDDHGLVVVSQPGSPAPNQAAYMSFAHPGSFVTLIPGSTERLVCPAVDRVAVACATEDQDGGVTSIQLLPVTGEPATTVTDGRLSEMLALNGKTVLYSAGSGLSTFRLGHPKVHTGPKRLTPVRYNRDISGTDPYPDIRQFGISLLGALGGAVETSRLVGKGVALATSIDHAKRLFIPPPSPATVSDFTLNSGRIAYATDQRLKHHAAAEFSTFTTRVTSEGTAGFARPSLLHAGSDYVLAGISSSTTVYAVRSGQEHADLLITYKGKTHRIKRIPFDSYLQVAGHRAMYAPDRRIDGGPTAVYDAATGKVRKIKTDASCCDRHQGSYGGRTPALAGGFVYYLKRDGAVWRHDLAKGTETRVSRPTPGIDGGVVFADHRHVAWTLIHGSNFAHSSAYADPAGKHAPVSVAQRIIGLSSAGLLTTTGDLSEQPQSAGVVGAYSLQRFDGKRMGLLSKRSVFRVPQIDGHTVVWVSLAGQLHVKTLP